MNKKAIIIGATSGIGRGLAEILAADGYRVGITGRRTALLEELRSQRPDCFVLRTLDVCNLESIVPTLESLVDELGGGLDLLVINSGTGTRNPSLDFETELPAIYTNVVGYTCVADWTYKYFERHAVGHLVAITSVAGLRGMRFAPAYNASKAYQINYLEGLKQKAVASRKNIIITDVRPGFVDTALAQGEGVFWMASVEKAAKQIYSAIKAKKRTVCITKRWRLIHFAIRLIPNVIYNKI